MSPAYLAERRAHVLAAAARCFAREGFHRTTMQHIVREAGLSPGALYRYFASKEDIVAAIADERHQAERELFRQAQAGDGLMALASAFLGRLDRPGEREWRRVTVQLWGEALRNPRVMEVAPGPDEPLRRLTALRARASATGGCRATTPPPLPGWRPRCSRGWCCSRRSRSWTCRASCGRRSACWKGSPARRRRGARYDAEDARVVRSTDSQVVAGTGRPNR